jgi:hypothetical protein
MGLKRGDRAVLAKALDPFCGLYRTRLEDVGHEFGGPLTVLRLVTTPKYFLPSSTPLIPQGGLVCQDSLHILQACDEPVSAFMV